MTPISYSKHPIDVIELTLVLNLSQTEFSVVVD